MKIFWIKKSIILRKKTFLWIIWRNFVGSIALILLHWFAQSFRWWFTWFKQAVLIKKPSHFLEITKISIIDLKSVHNFWYFWEKIVKETLEIRNGDSYYSKWRRNWNLYNRKTFMFWLPADYRWPILIQSTGQSLAWRLYKVLYLPTVTEGQMLLKGL